ncbi:MAG: hypothetical protein IT542_10620 [Rubellimicrobium sp.]|nr:hypothetical protein [Rubellimicrobium sp.]
MSGLARLIAALGVTAPPEEMARILQGAAEDRAAADRLRAWLAARERDGA